MQKTNSIMSPDEEMHPWPQAINHGTILAQGDRRCLGLTVEAKTTDVMRLTVAMSLALSAASVAVFSVECMSDEEILKEHDKLMVEVKGNYARPRSN